MRRKDRARNDGQFFMDVTDKANILFLAFHKDAFPLCLPFNFARIDRKFYIHSAKEGSKLELIARNNHVGFSMAIDVAIDREKSTTYYKSVCGEGIALIVEDPAEKGVALDALAIKYNALCVRPATPQAIARVAIIRIDVLSFTGKACLPA